MLANCNPIAPSSLISYTAWFVHSNNGCHHHYKTTTDGQWLISPSERCLYHWLGKWHVPNKHPNSSPQNLKFWATSTRTMADPPADCQHTTVTKHTTFYTTTASHGHISKLTMGVNWTSYLEDLPEDIKWVFVHSNIKETRPNLAVTLAHEPIIAVSDGSYKDTQDTAAWVVYMESAPMMVIAHGVLMTPGHSNTQGSY